MADWFSTPIGDLEQRPMWQIGELVDLANDLARKQQQQKR